MRGTVDLTGADVIVNDAFGAGCSSSIAAALAVVDARCDVLVLMLGDQPGVTAATVATLLAGRGEAPLAICRYDDGRGHPIAFARRLFADLAGLHGDKGVWRLLDQRAGDVTEVPVAGRIPLDVDTLGGLPGGPRRPGRGMSPRRSPGRRRASCAGSCPTSRPWPGAWPASTTSSTRAWPRRCSSACACPSRCCSRARPGVGKTEAAKSLAAVLDTPLIRLQCYEGIDAAEALYEWNYPRQLLSIRLADASGSTLREDDLFGADYLIRRPLLRALEHPGPRPAVLLIDEIDRADDDFEAFLLELLARGRA